MVNSWNDNRRRDNYYFLFREKKFGNYKIKDWYFEIISILFENLLRTCEKFEMICFDKFILKGFQTELWNCKLYNNYGIYSKLLHTFTSNANINTLMNGVVRYFKKEVLIRLFFFWACNLKTNKYQNNVVVEFWTT